jgi:hypothetical protein
MFSSEIPSRNWRRLQCERHGARDVCAIQAFAHCMSTTDRLGALRERFALTVDKLYDNGIMMSS